MTHDSIGLGEDGPTHQPVEHLASLRAMPNVYVFRPADVIETIESWQLALKNIHVPSILVLSRQALPKICHNRKNNMVEYGAYIIDEYEKTLDITIFATGSEVSIALDAKSKLEKHSVGVRIVSMPCTELFEQQTTQYKNNILDNDSIKVAIEAGSSYGWEKYIGNDGIFIGIDSFGASANAQALYKHFKITTDDLVEACLNKINRK